MIDLSPAAISERHQERGALVGWLYQLQPQVFRDPDQLIRRIEAGEHRVWAEAYHPQAIVLLLDIEKGLRSGIDHTDVHGRPLHTVMQILTALRRDGQVILSGGKLLEGNKEPKDELRP